jgi:hypothetical protein
VPLTSSGLKTLGSMAKTYGKEKAKKVFYASINSGKLKGMEKPKKAKKK